jgi:hypothetical protein
MVSFSRPYLSHARSDLPAFQEIKKYNNATATNEIGERMYARKMQRIRGIRKTVPSILD